MRNRSQVVLPINLEIKLPKDDFVYKVAEICDTMQRRMNTTVPEAEGKNTDIQAKKQQKTAMR